MANSLAVWRNYLNQRRLTTGQAPTPEELQALRMAELEAAYSQKSRNRQLALQEKSVANQYDLGQRGLENQWNLGQQQIAQAKDAAAAQKQASLISSGIQLPLAAYAGYKILKDTFGKPVGNIGGAVSTTENIPSMNPTDMWAPTDTTYAVPADVASAYEAAPSIGAAGAPAAAEATGMTAADAIGGMWAGAEVPAYEAGTAWGAGMATSANPGMWTAVSPYLAGAGMAYGLDQMLNEGRISDTVQEAGEDLWNESRRTWENVYDTVGEPVVDFVSDAWDNVSDWISDAWDWTDDAFGWADPSGWW